MTVSITTLVENTAAMPYVLGEWGQGMLIEADGQKILFDTGPSGVIVANAAKMGIDLGAVDKIVLSHGHYDHTGGLKDVLKFMCGSGKKPGGVEVIAHPDIFQPKYFCIKGLPSREIGIPFSRKEMEDAGAKFTLSKEPVYLSMNVMTTGEVKASVDFEPIEPSLHCKTGSELVPDLLNDDLGMIVRTDKGLVLLLGCAHRGMINTIRHAIRLTGEERIYAVLGGTHLMMAGEERVLQTISALRELGIGKLGTSHCTGMKQSAILAMEFGDSFFFNNAGTRIVL